MPEFVIEKLPTSDRLVNINPNQITRRFKRAFLKLDIRAFRFHDLRHYAASIMHAIGVPDQYIMQRGGWGSDRTLKATYRGTIEEYTQKYTDITLSHFDSMQHEMQHEKSLESSRLFESARRDSNPKKLKKAYKIKEECTLSTVSTILF